MRFNIFTEFIKIRSLKYINEFYVIMMEDNFLYFSYRIIFHFSDDFGYSEYQQLLVLFYIKNGMN